MVPADEGASIEFPLAEQSALMRAVTVEDPPTGVGSHKDHIHIVRGKSERPCRPDFAEIGDASECFRLHRLAPASDRTLS